jgi:ATP-dependent Zn protease
LTKKNRNPKNFKTTELAKQSKGFSGAELEEVVKEALFQAYDEEKEITDEHISAAIDKTFPLSRTMHETIEKMRKWAKSRAVSASTDEPESLDDKDKDVPKLKQESYSNPFI